MTRPRISSAKLMRLWTALAATLTSAATDRLPDPPAGRVYFGTYTAPGKSRGIYMASFDVSTGTLGAPKLVAETESPSFLAIHPTRPLLYAVNEVARFEGRPEGSISAFEVDQASGALRGIGRVSSKGAHPCHLVVDGLGEHVLVANYTGGSVASFPLRPDGSLGDADAFIQHTGSSVDSKRQSSPHAHMIHPDPANRYALVADLGLDQVLLYGLDSGRLNAAAPHVVRTAPGSGPRHFASSPDGRDLYLLNEMSLTVTAFKYGAGRLTEFQTESALPAGRQVAPTDSGAEILVHPGGRFVYASLRGHDSLAVFSRDAATGRLVLKDHVPTDGQSPRTFAIDPSGRYILVANQRSNQVVVFRIDQESGGLSRIGPPVDLSAPVAIAFASQIKGRP